jgi:hypothetical protein
VTRRSRLYELSPRYDFNEVHARVIAAPPDPVFEAVKTVTLGEMPLVRLLFGIRSLPARLARGRGLPRAKDEPLFGEMVELAFTVLAEDPKREIVAGPSRRCGNDVGRRQASPTEPSSSPSTARAT